MSKTITKRLKIYAVQLVRNAVKELEDMEFPRAMARFHADTGGYCYSSLLQNNPNYQRHLTSYSVYKDCLMDLYETFPEVRDLFKGHDLGRLMEEELAQRRRGRQAEKAAKRKAG